MAIKKKLVNYPPSHKDLAMYFSPEITEKFAKLEQNEKNFQVAEIIDQFLIQELNSREAPVYSAELGGGAHPDRYHKFFAKLLREPRGHIDWVDISPYMLELAKKYISNEQYYDRKKVISFIKSDILEYLAKLETSKLDLVIMKYTIDHIADLTELFKLLSSKLKPGGKLIATIKSTNPELKSYSTNARSLYNGQEFPADETRILKDGDSFTLKFFKVSGRPDSGYLAGAETIKYFHSAAKIKQLAQTFNFTVFLGDWKDFIEKVKPRAKISKETINQEILVLKRK